MVNLKHYDCATFQMLHFPVLNFSNLQLGQNISPEKWLCELFFNKD